MDEWRNKIQEWYSGTGSKLYAWVKSKSKWNAELEHVATGGDGKEPRAEGISTDMNHFGDPIEIHADTRKFGKGLERGLA